MDIAEKEGNFLPLLVVAIFWPAVNIRTRKNFCFILPVFRSAVLSFLVCPAFYAYAQYQTDKKRRLAKLLILEEVPISRFSFSSYTDTCIMFDAAHVSLNV